MFVSGNTNRKEGIYLQTIELTLKFNTPVFARGGSDGFEITPQSIKGIMRFWYRALLPNVIDIHRCGDVTKPYCGMKRAEELLFGSTNQRSLFDVEVDVGKNVAIFPMASLDVTSQKYLLDSNRLYEKFSAPDYAAYGLYSEKETNKPIRQFLTENSNVKITFAFKTKNLSNKVVDELKYYLPLLFEMIACFGGVGAKSRKGYGSFDIVGEKKITNNSLNEIINKLSKGTEKILESLEALLRSRDVELFSKKRLYLEKSIINSLPEFPSLNDKCLLLAREISASKWQDAMDKVYFSAPQKLTDSKGSVIRNDRGKPKMKKSYESKFGLYRGIKVGKYRIDPSNSIDIVDKVREIIYRRDRSTNFANTIFKSSIFGLPLLYQGIDCNENRVGKGQAYIGDLKRENSKIELLRKASPIFISFHPSSQNGKMIVHILIIPSRISRVREGNLPSLYAYVKENNTITKVFGNENFDELKRYFEEKLRNLN